MTNSQAFCLKVKDIDSSSPSGRARALSGCCMSHYAPRESERGLYRFQDRLSGLDFVYVLILYLSSITEAYELI